MSIRIFFSSNVSNPPPYLHISLFHGWESSWYAKTMGWEHPDSTKNTQNDNIPSKVSWIMWLGLRGMPFLMGQLQTPWPSHTRCWLYHDHHRSHYTLPGDPIKTQIKEVITLQLDIHESAHHHSLWSESEWPWTLCFGALGGDDLT